MQPLARRILLFALIAGVAVALLVLAFWKDPEGPVGAPSIRESPETSPLLTTETPAPAEEDPSAEKASPSRSEIETPEVDQPLAVTIRVIDAITRDPVPGAVAYAMDLGRVSESEMRRRLDSRLARNNLIPR